MSDAEENKFVLIGLVPIRYSYIDILGAAR